MMRVEKLTIAGLRAFAQAEFTFLPGVNLLVGINGVGKTTVLDALRISLSRVFPEISSSKGPKQNFELSDIKIGMEALQVACDFEHQENKFNLLLQKKRESIQPRESGKVREQVTETPDIEQISPSISTLFPKAKKDKRQPIAIFYSTRRSLTLDYEPSKTAIAGGQAAAFTGSLLNNRDTNLRLFAHWYRAQEKLAEEIPRAERHLGVLQNAISEFLPGFSNLHVVDHYSSPHFMIDKDGVPLSISQLSDGERGIISIVLDLAKRLSQANPDLDNPLEGEGIILIDEIDLHLHPKWQRSVIANFVRTFPNCQFIATTHSPQIIGEVDAKQITVIDNGTYHPLVSFGVDSSRILSEILDTPQRNKEVDVLLEKLFSELDKENLKTSKQYLEELKKILGPNDPEITRTNTMISFLENDLDDEANKKK